MSAFTEGNRRHFRLTNMLQTEGKLVMLLYLETYFCGRTLADYLSDRPIQAKLYKLLKQRTPKVLSSIQYDTLYPKTGHVDIDKLDISLLFVLIRSLHPALAQIDKVWNDPLPENLSAEADVTRIGKLRHRLLGHAGTCELTENEFVYEYQKLEMILTRLLKNITTIVASRDELVQIISVSSLIANLKQKFSGSFDAKPVSTEVSVNTCDEIIPEPEVCMIEKMNVSTSTSSLQKKRKLSFRIKAFLDPFIMGSRLPTEEKHDFLPSKAKVKHTIAKRKSKRLHCNSSCILPGGCRSRYSRVSVFQTNHHIYSASRCLLSGVVHLENGVTVVTDTVHDALQAFNSNNELIDEVMCPKPRGICAISDDTVLVTLRYDSKVLMYKCHPTKPIRYINDINISCDGWMYDVKYSNGRVYVLCDKKEMHIIHLEESIEYIRCLPVEGKVEYFDVTPSGDKLVLSDSRGVICLDEFGNQLWHYRGTKTSVKTTGLVLLKDRVIVAAWEDNRLLQLTLNGSLVREIGTGQVLNPLAVCHVRGAVIVTQYMSDLSEDLCREIVTLRD